MRLDMLKSRASLPDVERCCCFVPLRCGILIFGYFNLISTILIIFLNGLVGVSPGLTPIVSNYRGLSDYWRWLPLTLYGVEIVFDVLLVVGAHMKQPILMRFYYYYGIVSTVTTFLAFIELQVNNIEQDWYWIVLEYCFAFSGFVLQIYILLLIRTQLKQLKEQQRDQENGQVHSEALLDQPSFGTERKK